MSERGFDFVYQCVRFAEVPSENAVAPEYEASLIGPYRNLALRGMSFEFTPINFRPGKCYRIRAEEVEPKQYDTQPVSVEDIPVRHSE